MRQRRRHILISIRLLMALIVVTISATGALLCFGTDGHIAIELVERCGGSEHRLSSSEDESPDACGPCVDVHFPGIDVIAGQKTSPAFIFAIFAMLFVGFASVQTISVFFMSRKADFPFGNNLAIPKSVVLLI